MCSNPAFVFFGRCIGRLNVSRRLKSGFPIFSQMCRIQLLSFRAKHIPKCLARNYRWERDFLTELTRSSFDRITWRGHGFTWELWSSVKFLFVLLKRTSSMKDWWHKTRKHYMYFSDIHKGPEQLCKRQEEHKEVLFCGDPSLAAPLAANQSRGRN